MHKTIENTQADNFWGEPISVYTAQEAVEDGTLIDVSEMAQEAGFSKAFAVRITTGVHELCTPPKSNKIQSYDGRLWDVLWMCRCAIKREPEDKGLIVFTLKIGRRIVSLWACLDTTSGPAIHIITPEEY